MTSRPKYSGTRRKLVLAFDVGTTYSGISYRSVYRLLSPSTYQLADLIIESILDPGFVPEIKGVTKYALQLFLLVIF